MDKLRIVAHIVQNRCCNANSSVGHGLENIIILCYHKAVELVSLTIIIIIYGRIACMGGGPDNIGKRDIINRLLYAQIHHFITGQFGRVYQKTFLAGIGSGCCMVRNSFRIHNVSARIQRYILSALQSGYNKFGIQAGIRTVCIQWCGKRCIARSRCTGKGVGGNRIRPDGLRKEIQHAVVTGRCAGSAGCDSYVFTADGCQHIHTASGSFHYRCIVSRPAGQCQHACGENSCSQNSHGSFESHKYFPLSFYRFGLCFLFGPSDSHLSEPDEIPNCLHFTRKSYI